jgi:hypothetical protein
MWLSLIGLGMNFLGTILVAFSVKKGKVYAWKDNENQPEHMASFKLAMFRWGIGCLAVGFLLQALSLMDICVWRES